jgi:ABC-type Fe3+/spermidine/putrescine transport system ATPase subunit
VAEFIGKTNLIDAVVENPDTVTRDGLWLRVAADDLTPDTRVAVSIRPHEIQITTGEPPSPRPLAGVNTLRGTIRGATYLGTAIDYQVEVAGIVLRVTAPVLPRQAVGDVVTVRIDRSACVPLMDD